MLCYVTEILARMDNNGNSVVLVYSLKEHALQLNLSV